MKTLIITALIIASCVRGFSQWSQTESYLPGPQYTYYNFTNYPPGTLYPITIDGQFIDPGSVDYPELSTSVSNAVEQASIMAPVALTGAYSSLTGTPYPTQPLSSNAVCNAGGWITNNMGNEIFVHVKYTVNLSAVAGNVTMQAWTRPSYTSSTTITNDYKGYNSLAAFLTSVSIPDSMIIEVPPHWVFCPITNIVSTGLGNTPPATGVYNATLLP